mmetsp:Transcript_96647/g.196382  ORF Transcript_96647/g.196382 Transcript_96647/m.196382 type:complete len:205 (-) Transcript_96647:143-757(-)
MVHQHRPDDMCRHHVLQDAKHLSAGVGLLDIFAKQPPLCLLEVVLGTSGNDQRPAEDAQPLDEVRGVRKRAIEDLVSGDLRPEQAPAPEDAKDPEPNEVDLLKAWDEPRRRHEPAHQGQHGRVPQQGAIHVLNGLPHEPECLRPAEVLQQGAGPCKWRHVSGRDVQETEEQARVVHLDGWPAATEGQRHDDTCHHWVPHLAHVC